MTSIIKLRDLRACCVYRAARMKTLALYAKRVVDQDDILQAVMAGIEIGAYSGREFAIGEKA
jgi:hypothetical protein